MRILVVEDNVEVARQIKDSLEQELFIVDVAHDGEEGWFLGDTEPYDAVILDIGLPKLDGLSLLQRWRRTSNRVPVLILTSRDTWRQKVIGLRVGADDYLAKPFQPSELLLTIRKARERERLRRANALLQRDVDRAVGERPIVVGGDPQALRSCDAHYVATVLRLPV